MISLFSEARSVVTKEMAFSVVLEYPPQGSLPETKLDTFSALGEQQFG